MSATREELAEFLKEAERMKDMPTAEKILTRLEEMQAQEQPAPAPAPAQPAPAPQPVQPQAPVAPPEPQGGELSAFINEAGRQGFTAPNLQNKLIEKITGEKLEFTKGAKAVGSFIEDWWQQEGDLLAQIGKTEFGKKMKRAISMGAEQVAKLADAYPQEFAVTEAALAMYAPVRFKGSTKAPVLKSEGKIPDFVKEIVTPKLGAKKAGERMMAQGVEGGFFKGVSLSESEKAIAKEVMKVKGITDLKPMKANFDLIQKESFKTGKEIQVLLRKSNKRYDIKDVNKAIGEKFSEVINRPIFTEISPALKTKRIRVLSTQIREIFKKFPNNPAGVHAARQELDKMYGALKGKDPFTLSKQETLELALYREARDSLNNMVDSVSPQIKNLRGKQSNLINALTTFAPKAVKGAESLGEAMGGATDKLISRSVTIKK